MTTTNPPSDGVARDLENAATLLRERGWCQGRFHDSRGRSCAAGAIRVVTGDTDAELAARRALRRVVGGEAIALWNDKIGRTAEEVITALESAAALARASGGAS
jgi:hypothetical protein